MQRKHKWPWRACVCAWTGAVSLLCAWPAIAKDCSNLAENKAYSDGFNQLSEAYKKQDWNTALKIGKQLESICDESPFLNYTIAQIHKNLGNKNEYHFYLTNSTRNTEKYGVDKDMLNKIWSERYVADHPEAAPERIIHLETELSRTKQLLGETIDEKDLLANEKDQLAKSTISKDEHLAGMSSDFKTPMWIGTGVGIGGLVMAAIGAGLLGSYPDSARFPDTPKQTYDENPIHATGWVLLGIGSGLAIGGAIFAGIFGYKYKHYKETQSWTINIFPNYTSLSFEF